MPCPVQSLKRSQPRDSNRSSGSGFLGVRVSSSSSIQPGLKSTIRAFTSIRCHLPSCFRLKISALVAMFSVRKAGSKSVCVFGWIIKFCVAAMAELKLWVAIGWFFLLPDFRLFRLYQRIKLDHSKIIPASPYIFYPHTINEIKC